MRTLALVLALFAAPSAMAASYDISLGGRVIGSMTATATAIDSTLDNTPLGAADGWFAARRAGDSYSATNSDGRQIDLRFDGGAVTGVTVTPPEERTDASTPGVVPQGTLDPVSGFARIAEATDCTPAFRMYDGRRVITVTPTARTVEGGAVTCRFAYRVTAGPGHVSPFRVTDLTMTATYAPTLARLTVRAGPFAVALTPR